jgi:hypothetical protein
MILDQDVLERWMAGAPVPGVGLAFCEPVVIREGPFAGCLGTVISLIALEAEPVYTVELGAGRGDVHLPESALDAA